MFSVEQRTLYALLITLTLSLAACGNLAPSGEDKRTAATSGTGHAVGQTAPDFTMTDTKGGAVSLATLLASGKPVVLYFTMWCPICDSHMQNMQTGAMAQFPAATYIAVDYVSGNAVSAAASQEAAGYGGAPFIVAADEGQVVLNAYHATMGTTVVIDTAGAVKMNEDYKDGAALLAALGAL